MNRLENLKNELKQKPSGKSRVRNYYLAKGLRAHMDEPNVIARAYAIKELFENIYKHVYNNDIILGSVRGLLSDEFSTSELQMADSIVNSYGSRYFTTNADHFAPDYETFFNKGINGAIETIENSLISHQHCGDYNRNKKYNFLTAAKITMEAFSNMIHMYGEQAIKMGLTEAGETCFAIERGKPESFRQALQLMWFSHIAFYTEGRYAMAIGRMDQFLYPFYKRDVEKGILKPDEALEMVECTLYKIREAWYFGGDDVVNIAIGGVKPEDGSDAVNELTYIILRAVGDCNIPGPNLSARLHNNIAPGFIDECLKVIGTGLGYPALMNDEVNIPALHRHGYSLEDSRNYCMVGCIENFIAGKQPPWSDGRYNTPKYIELALNNGVCMLTGSKKGVETGDPSDFDTMEKFMKALETQMEYGASEYMMYFRNENERYNKINYMQPFLSCYCDNCLERGLDINDGGAIYPSVHGAGCMGIATVADSLAAIEKYVYNEKILTLAKLRDILKVNYEGYPEIKQLMLSAPKYGNDDDFADKYAVWFVVYQDYIFSKYRTHDGGAIYTAIASNVSNIPAGAEVAATPDGRGSGEPVSDAASPMHGRDKNGPTAVIKSLSKPDYSLVSCGTVVNQKYSPDMFKDPVKRQKLSAMIRSYFKLGGQEIQINSVSRDVLTDAMNNPEKYSDLVVRVSGFSAYYVLLGRGIQEDILKRTEHE